MIHICLLLAAAARPIAPPNPRALVDSAIVAMQRSASLKSFHALRLVGIQHEFALGNAERSEGPWRVSYSQFAELRDLDAPRLRRTEQGLSANGNKSADRITTVTDSVVALTLNGRQSGGSHGLYEDLIDRIDGLPDRALSLAAAAQHLAYDGVVKRYGLSFDVVSFPWRNGRIRVELSRETRLPSAIEIFRSYGDNFRWAPFGDVTMRTDYVDWNVMPEGPYWPMQMKTSLNGQPLRDITLARATFTATPPPSDSFVVSDSAREQYAAASALNFSRFRLGMRGQPSELAPGIVRVVDQWAQTLVKQPDGVVIFEAHISAQYLHDVIGEAQKRWPTLPIKALVMTSDPWAHLGGLREAIALGIPVYVNARSIPFLTTVAKAPHTIAPDSLARSRRAPKFVPVSAKTVIGRGENSVELYPVGGPYAERMLIAYFPGHKLLYGADLVFPNRGPDGKFTKSFFETSAVDLRRTVEREKLAVDSLFCVQNYPMVAWSTFIAP
jgi:hypothetical protein